MGDDAIFTDDPLGVYLSQVRLVPAMDQAEEIACIEHVKARDDMSEAARKRLIEANLGLDTPIRRRSALSSFGVRSFGSSPSIGGDPTMCVRVYLSARAGKLVLFTISGHE